MAKGMTKKEFYDKIEEWISHPKDRWNHVTAVAYFYHKYHERNGVHFTPARWSGNPASSKECRDFAKVFKIFVDENYDNMSASNKREERIRVYQKIYNYINWMFDYKHRYGDKGRAVTTQFFIAPYSLNEFVVMYNRAMKKAASKGTIDKLIKWCKEEMPEVLDSHQITKAEDIKLIDKYADMYGLPENSNERRLVARASEMGII